MIKALVIAREWIVQSLSHSRFGIIPPDPRVSSMPMSTSLLRPFALSVRFVAFRIYVRLVLRISIVGAVRLTIRRGCCLLVAGSSCCSLPFFFLPTILMNSGGSLSTMRLGVSSEFRARLPCFVRFVVPVFAPFSFFFDILGDFLNAVGLRLFRLGCRDSSR